MTMNDSNIVSSAPHLTSLLAGLPESTDNLADRARGTML